MARELGCFGVGLAAGALLARALSKRITLTLQPPTRVFKLAIAEEVAAFEASGKICSSLDKADGFVHLSDRTSPPKVASLFFKGAQDLFLLELDASKFSGPIHWVAGVMGDAAPSASVLAVAKTVVHYLVSDGCVHVYGSAGVSMGAVVRKAKVPLGSDGVHVFPEWL